jgi:glycopeptide antibiotics resistance protein
MIPRIFHPFLPYRSLFLPILQLCAIVVPCWLAFRLYRARNSGQRLSFSREILLLIFVAYLAGLAAVTLGPNRPSRRVAEAMVGVDLRPSLASLTCSAGSLPRGSADRGFCVRNARGNAVLFFPLGILLPLVWRRLRFWRGLQIALALSIGIEIVQVLSRAWGSYRSADVNDVILNVLGAGLGLGLVSLLRLRQGTRSAVQRV